MKRKNAAKILSLILAFSMILAFVPLQPAFAVTSAGAVAAAIETLNSNFSTAVNGAAVTVTGKAENQSGPLTIDIPAGITVEWGASLSGVGGSGNLAISRGAPSLLNLTGEGKFILNASGSVVSNAASTTGIAVVAAGPALTLNGRISNQSGPAVLATLTKDITVAGGLVTSANMNAICVSADGATVRVTGGSVLTGLPMSPAITFNGFSGGMNVFITGGSVQNVMNTQPTDDSNTPVPVFLVPVHVTNPGGVFDVTAYYTKNSASATYQAQTDSNGDAYLWLPAGDAMILATNDDKSGQVVTTVSGSGNTPVGITVTSPEEDAAAEITAYNTNNGGGTGSLTATVSGGTVTVTGSLTNATKQLKFTVPEDVKVIWKATLTGSGSLDQSNPSNFLQLLNNGVFEIAEGAEITNFGPKSLAISSGKGSVIMSGGKVASTATPSFAIGTSRGSFLMTGGEASGTLGAVTCSDGTAVITGGTLSVSAPDKDANLLFVNNSIAAVRSNIQVNPVSYQDTKPSGVILVDSAADSARVGTSAGLSATIYGLTEGVSLIPQWAIQNNVSGIEVLLTVPGSTEQSLFIPFPGVKVREAKHTVSYDANGGSGSTGSAVVDDDADYTAAANRFTRTDYSFTGWNTKANGSGTAYAAGAVVNHVQADITLYAQWSPSGSSSGTNSSSSGNPGSSSSAGGGSAPVRVSLTQPDTVKAEVFAAAKEKKNSAIYSVLGSDGKVKYEWTFKGDKMSRTDLNIDLTLNVRTELPANIKFDFATGNPLVLEFGYHGDLPGETDVKIYVGDKYKDGTALSLYYYNSQTGKTEFVSDGLTVKDGYVTITINHCSTYLLVEGKANPIPKTGDAGNATALIALGAAALFGLVLLQFIRRRKAGLKK